MKASKATARRLRFEIRMLGAERDGLFEQVEALRGEHESMKSYSERFKRSTKAALAQELELKSRIYGGAVLLVRFARRHLCHGVPEPPIIDEFLRRAEAELGPLLYAAGEPNKPASIR